MAEGGHDLEGEHQQGVDVLYSVPLDEDKLYHIFVSYSTEDLNFVKNLVYGLETEHNLKCTYSARDFVAGHPVMAQIEEHITNSMVVVMILSPDFFRSNFCLFEVEVACRLDIDRKYHSIIPVMYQKCEVPARLMYINYIDVGQGEHVEKRILKTIQLRNAERSTGNERATSRNTSKKKEQEEVELEKFRQYLVGQYNENLSTVRVSPLCKPVNVLEMVQPLVIRMDIEQQLSESPSLKDEAGKKTEIKCCSEIFLKNEQSQRRICLLGEPGTGKTTFCHHLINLWCKLQTSPARDKYEQVVKNIGFLFYVQCKCAQQSESVLNMIYNQRCPLQKQKLVELIFTHYPEKCLVIVDGLDEWYSTSGLHALPDSTNIHGPTILITSRPWKIDALERVLSPKYRVVEIEGLRPGNIEFLCLEVLKTLGVSDQEKAYGVFFREITGKKMENIIKIPLMLIIVLTAWHDGKQSLKNALCMNYADLLELLIQHSEGKIQRSGKFHETVLPKCFSELPYCLQYSGLIEKLSKLAFDTFVDSSKEFSHVFTKQDLLDRIGKKELQVCLHLGLLSQSTAPSQSQQCKVRISFLHKSLQEFLAAVYFSGNSFKDCFRRFCRSVTSLEQVFNCKLIVQFFCGLSPEKGPLVVKHIVEVAGRSHRSILDNSSAKGIQDFIFQCIDESNNVTETHISGEPQDPVSSDTSAVAGQSSQRSDQRPQYIIPDIVIGRFTHKDEIQWLCSQDRRALKSVIYEYHASSRLYVIESLCDMTQLEKLCVHVPQINQNQIVQILCRSLSNLKQLKTLSIFGSFSKMKTNVSADLLQAVGTLQTLISLYLSGLNLSMVTSCRFFSSLSSVSLFKMSVSSLVISALPLTLTYIKMENVSLSESASQQLCQLLSNSTCLQSLELIDLHSGDKTGFNQLTLPSLVNLSSLYALHRLDLRGVVLYSGIQVTPTSQLAYIHMLRVKMSADCWGDFIHSLPTSPSKQLTAVLQFVNIDKRTVWYIDTQFTMTRNWMDSEGERIIEFNTETDTPTT